MAIITLRLRHQYINTKNILLPYAGHLLPPLVTSHTPHEYQLRVTLTLSHYWRIFNIEGRQNTLNNGHATYGCASCNTLSFVTLRH